MAVLAMGGLACACQVAPMGAGLMDDSTTAVATPGTAQASVAPAPPPPSLTPPPASAGAPGPAIPPPAPAPGLLDLLDRPAERALLAGLRAYDDGQYPESEAQLRRALEGNLRATRDRTTARKLLAFIYCTTARPAQCEAEFRAALRDDPSFTLSRGEAGHPMWGPVYKRVKPQ